MRPSPKSPVFSPDTERITSAMLASNTSNTSKEMAAELVDAWVEKFSSDDLNFRTLLVETPWFYWVRGSERTLIVGVMDRVMWRKEFGVLGGEWKTGKEPKQNRDGQDSAWWNEGVWLDQMRTGSQLAFYGLALRSGTFALGEQRIPDGGKGIRNIWTPRVPDPYIFVRLAVKSSPPRFWPITAVDGMFHFPGDYLDIVEDAILAKAAAIRGARSRGLVPWALTGHHCESKFHKLCPFHEPFCLPHNHPVASSTGGFDARDPGAAGLIASGADMNDPALVVFSASSFQTAMECDEKYRIQTLPMEAQPDNLPEREEESLDVGTGLHAGVAELYRQQREFQERVLLGRVLNPLKR